MITRIKEFFISHLEPGCDAESEGVDPLQLAAAALMIEVSRADFSVDEEERASISRLLQEQFGLIAAELDALVEQAGNEAQQATSLYQFTRLINDNYSPEQKIQLVLNLWLVALADRYIDKHEDHLIRKIADLIHVPHKAFIQTKLQALELAGGLPGDSP